jgi:hypothetical protein
MMKNRNATFFIKESLAPTLAIILACVLAVVLPLTTRSQSLPAAPNLIPGQTATRLADGRLLLLGGESVAGGMNTASIWDPRTGTATVLSRNFEACCSMGIMSCT